MNFNNQRLLYLIQHSNKDMIKIGIATNNLRFKQIDSDYSINWDKSLYFKGENKDIVLMERILHKLFFKHQLENQKGTGGTEWFDIQCIKKVVDAIIFNVKNSELEIMLEAVMITYRTKEKRLPKPKPLTTHKKELLILSTKLVELKKLMEIKYGPEILLPSLLLPKEQRKLIFEQIEERKERTKTSLIDYNEST